MTLMALHLSRHGMVFASDSNLSGEDNALLGEAPKTFALPDLHAGLTVAGSYTVGGRPMSAWMPEFFAGQICSSLASFAEALGASLEAGMTGSEKRHGSSLVHIAGYVHAEGISHPEFHFVRNIDAIHPDTGAYTGVRTTFQSSEDFWSRDCQHRESPTGFVDDGSALYMNGYPDAGSHT